MFDYYMMLFVRLLVVLLICFVIGLGFVSGCGGLFWVYLRVFGCLLFVLRFDWFVWYVFGFIALVWLF